MTPPSVFSRLLPRLWRNLESLATFGILATLSAAAMAWYVYAYRSLVLLQQVSPEGLMRALTGA